MRDSTRWRHRPANTGQRNLFGGTPPTTQAAPPRPLPSNGTITSKAAAERAAARAPNQITRILDYLREQGERGATIDELVEALDILSQSASARVNGMRRDGMLRDSGQTRPTRSGCAAIVWVVSYLPASPQSGNCSP